MVATRRRVVSTLASRVGGLAPAPGAVGTEEVVSPSGVVTGAGMPRACRADVG
jgi:hypothetical protein